jgi:hypothetical protein
MWRCLGDIAIVWLTKLFNHIFQSNEMPEEWSMLVPILKTKGDIQVVLIIAELSWWAILWSYVRVIEHRLRRITRVSMNQFGFMPGRQPCKLFS